MTCKHENAEYMMPGDASTPDWCVQVYAEFEQFRCIDCGAWLSLGDSDEHASKAVEIEIRAAELVADMNKLSSTRTFKIGEWLGWDGKETTSLTVRDDVGNYRIDHDVPLNLDSPNWCAGYLARAIATHGKESE